ncbi:hypothetical protein DBR17_14775 [Sphingomonas sp. HMWF008]|nr:hypothetical protein DBR17_14775 [Sphingomonas sp. HMWF008]
MAGIAAPTPQTRTSGRYTGVIIAIPIALVIGRVSLLVATPPTGLIPRRADPLLCRTRRGA